MGRKIIPRVDEKIYFRVKEMLNSDDPETNEVGYVLIESYAYYQNAFFLMMWYFTDMDRIAYSSPSILAWNHIAIKAKSLVHNIFGDIQDRKFLSRIYQIDKSLTHWELVCSELKIKMHATTGGKRTLLSVHYNPGQTCYVDTPSKSKYEKIKHLF